MQAEPNAQAKAGLERKAGLEIDFLEWKVDLLPGVSVELVELIPGAIDLSEIYIKPGTILELDDVELLESKIAL